MLPYVLSSQMLQHLIQHHHLGMHVPAQLGQTTGSCQGDPQQRSAVVLVTDTCPQCESDHLDLQAVIWSKVSSSVATMPSSNLTGASA